MKSAVVTGAAGFIASHLCRALLAEGVTVIGCDARRPSNSPAIFDERQRYSFVECDITRKDTLGFMKEADTVFHLAAIANPRTCQENFQLGFNVNVEGTENVLDSCKKGARFIFMSGAMAYGDPLFLPFTEEHPLRGAQHPYSLTKILGEFICLAYARLKGLNVTVVRNFNTYGPGQTTEYVIVSMISQALAEGKIEVWDKSTSRDFTYVDDTAQALIRMAETESLVGQVVNLGSGREVSIGALADTISRVLGGVPVVDLKKVTGGGRQACDNSRLRQKTGWQPQVSLEDGLKRTIAALKEAKR